MRTELTGNDLRQMLRIAGGATLGFMISKLLELPYGIFFTVYPILLLGLVPIINDHIIREFLCAALFPAAVVLVIYGLFGSQPLLMTPLVFVIFAFLFWQMSKGVLFMFGALSAVGLSVQLHLASYGADIYALVLSNIGATVLSLLLACVMYAFFPDVTARTPPQRASKDAASVRHEVILCSVVATISFLVFQLFNLQDSISAQASSVLLLLPLCWKGISVSGLQRSAGTFIGGCLALLMQLMLSNHSDVLLFSSMSLWVLLFCMSRVQMRIGGGSNAAFYATTTFGMLYGQSLMPGQDIVYSALYRISSVAVAILSVLALVYLVHTVLNRFTSTRHHTFLHS